MGVLPDWAIRRDIKITPFAEGVKRESVISYGLTSYGYDIRLGYKFRVFTNTWCGVIDPKTYDPKAFVEVNLALLHTDHVWGETTIPSFEAQCVHCGVAFTNKHKNDSWLRACLKKTRPNSVTIPPNSFLLGESLETFDIPRDVLCVALGKSTYARCGIVANVTPGEPEWVGKWTIELSNTTPLPAKVYAGEGICQMIFLRTDGYHDPHRIVNAQTEEQLLHEMRIASCDVSYKDKAGKYHGQTGLAPPKVD